jgi:hypothetical protein
MANFGETRFLGLSPRAIGLSLVAIAIVVGLFFIPEGVKFIFDGKPRASREQSSPVQGSKQPAALKSGGGSPRAALSRDAVNASNTEAPTKKSVATQSADAQRISKRASDAEDASGSSKGGIFSGWDFSVKAHPSTGGKGEVPSTLSFEKVVSRDGVSFFKQGRGAIPRFLRQEGLLSGPAAEAVEPLQNEMNAIVAGNTKGASSQEVAGKLRSAHVSAIQGLRAAGADRGVILRWLEIPVVRFIDTQGGVMAAKRYRDAFAPGLMLKELSVGQRKQGSPMGSDVPAQFRAEFSITGTDVQKVVAYSNGKVVRSVKFSRAQNSEPRVVRINGDASGVWTVFVHDSFGARPYFKSYQFYPRAQVFPRQRDGRFRIAFLPGSGRNSLDRFFRVGATARSRPSDSVISTF